MAQLFSRRATLIFRLVLIGLPIAATGGLAFGLGYVRSDAYWNIGQVAAQPIPFPHDLHTGKLEVDCRYCHTSVERAARAGMPSATTCMSCHSRVWQGASLLEPLRTSLALGNPIRWSSVHRLASHVHFHHGAHVARGVACSSCHGDMTTTPRTVKRETMSMGWCLSCHRADGAHITGAATVSTPRSRRDDPVGAASLLTSCSTCHH